MEVIELIDLVSPSKSEKETKDESSQPLKVNTTRRRELYNPSISSLDVTVSGGSELDSSMEIVQENCKRMKLDCEETSLISLLSNKDFLPSNPASPSSQSGFIVQGQEPSSSDYYEEDESVLDTQDLLEKNKENSEPAELFITPPGPLRRVVLKENNSLNDLTYPRRIDPEQSKEIITNRFAPQVWKSSSPSCATQSRYVRPMTVALSQSAPGLACSCRRIQFGRGHGCLMKAKYCWN